MNRAPSGRILVIGPDPRALGGMAGVVQTMLSLDFPNRYQLLFQPITEHGETPENRLRRVVRHGYAIMRLVRILRRERPVVVHLHTCSGFSFYRSGLDLLVARRYGCRTVLHVHGAAFDEFCRRADPFQGFLISRLLSRADRVVVLSRGWRENLARFSPQARYVVIRNATAIPPTLPDRRREGPCRLLFLSRMDDWKGVDDLLDASQWLKRNDVAFELALAGPAGTAGDFRILQDKIESRGLGDRVSYTGPAVGEEKFRLFAWADAFVQPSHHEGMPLSLLEAMAFGLPVVATTVGAVPEVIHHGVEGLLAPPRQPRELAAALRALCTRPSLREQMSARARALVSREYPVNRFRDDLIRLYDDMLTRPSRIGGLNRIHGVKNPVGPVEKRLHQAVRRQACHPGAADASGGSHRTSPA